ncbi:MAG: hypothetical protein XD50_0585 [Clostridia bacterium 41_269]|nr:MAG: hypothetical protein XD50_0585 [Clostridia bacterium 41_269]
MLKNFQYGGQAVIEGVMMRGPREMAVAVRDPKGEIIVERQPLIPLGERFSILGRPIFRGIVALFEALVLGIKTLTFSANVAMDDGEEEEKLSTLEMVLTIAVAVGLAVLLFVVVPVAAVHYGARYLSPIAQNILEGFIRIVVFLGYVAGISLMEDIKRVFQYHGAEHKVIHAYEVGEDLSRIENIQKYSTLHPRCGTAFLLMVVILTIFFFSFLGKQSLFLRILSRILLLPLIAGAAYEIIKFASKHTDNKLVYLLILPGLWLQKLTTREPDDLQVEVALRALNEVLPTEKKIHLSSSLHESSCSSFVFTGTE